MTDRVCPGCGGDLNPDHPCATVDVTPRHHTRKDLHMIVCFECVDDVRQTLEEWIDDDGEIESKNSGNMEND